VKLDTLVNPLKAIADYRTNITGVSKKDLEGVECSLVDVQVRCLYKLLAYFCISFMGIIFVLFFYRNH
jgi:RNA exonuclease 1